MKLFISLVTVAVFVSCNNRSLPGYSTCRYFITKDYIESNCDFKQAIVFEEVKIDSFSLDGIPEKYTALNFLTISRINPTGPTLNRLYFFNINSNYEWNYINKSTLHETLPIPMRSNSWYLIRALVVNGNPNGKIFIYIDEEFEYHFIYTSIKTAY